MLGVLTDSPQLHHELCWVRTAASQEYSSARCVKINHHRDWFYSYWDSYKTAFLGVEFFSLMVGSWASSKASVSAWSLGVKEPTSLYSAKGSGGECTLGGNDRSGSYGLKHPAQPWWLLVLHRGIYWYKGYFLTWVNLGYYSPCASFLYLLFLPWLGLPRVSAKFLLEEGLAL